MVSAFAARQRLVLGQYHGGSKIRQRLSASRVADLVLVPSRFQAMSRMAFSTFLGAEGDRDRYVLETGSSMPPRSTFAAPRARLGDSALASRASAGMLGKERDPDRP
jgi:hypothetical protein